MPVEGRPFASLRVTVWLGVILSKAKNLSAGLGRRARACPERSEGACPEQSGGMRRYILETEEPRAARLLGADGPSPLDDHAGTLCGIM
jgi:hypothetical protein